MTEYTPRFGLATYEPGATDWSHTDTVEALDHVAIEHGSIESRPTAGTYDDELFHAVDQGIVWRWDEPTQDWRYFAGKGSGGQSVPGTTYVESLRIGPAGNVHVYVDDGSLVIDEGDTPDENYLFVPFDDESQILSHTDRNEIIPNPDGDGNVLKIGFPSVGDTTGASWRYYTSDYTDVEVAENAHARFFLYIPEDFVFFDVHRTGGFKLPGFADTEYGAGSGGRYPNEEEHDGWSARGTTYKPSHSWATDEAPGLGTQLYHYGVEDRDEAVGGGPLEPGFGHWHQIDQYVEINEPGVEDGTLVVWIDGEQVYAKTDAMYRDDDVEFLGIREFWWHIYFGGFWGARRDDEWLAFRDLEIWWEHGPQLPIQ